MPLCFRLIVPSLLAFSVATAQVSASNVRSARLESIATVPDRASIHVIIRNNAARPITAFSVQFYKVQPNGQRTPCGGRGADMIDWSDPMPGRDIYIHMRRKWIPPNGTASFDGYPRCPDGAAPLESIQTELSLIIFDEGSGEGDPRQMEFTFQTRQQACDERLKWIGRFTALRNTANLKLSSQSLYQDLVDATRSAEINPDEAARHGIAKAVRDELRGLALDITQWAASNEPLHKNELLEWRITDLEQRTTRLVHGTGNADVNRRE